MLDIQFDDIAERMKTATAVLAVSLFDLIDLDFAAILLKNFEQFEIYFHVI